jgi:hypothetical protein
MVKLFVFWGAFGAVLLGVIYTLVQNRRQKAVRPTLPGRMPTAAPVASEIPLPEATPAATVSKAALAEKAAEFDPAATRIYARPEPVVHASNQRDRAAPSGPLRGSPVLVCLGGRQKGHRHPIAGIGLSIGRADDNDVIIIDGRVSSHHAWIGLVAGKVILRDYQSLNGTFLNAQMDVPVSEVALLDGDTIFFGGHGGDQYRFVLE